MMKLFIGILIPVLAAYLWHWSEHNMKEAIKEELLSTVGQNGLDLFTQYDIDADGYLSMLEFEPIIHRLLNIKVSLVF